MIGIILFRPEKPANLGNIMRTCVATSTKLFIIGPLSFEFDDKSLKRAGMDYIEDLDYVFYKDYEEFDKKFIDKNIFYVTRYSKNTYSSFDYSDILNDIYFMFGRESTGIPHEILRKNIDKTVRIPMAPCARSLNLSNSVSIVLYEALRQQKFRDLATHEEIKGEDFLENEEKTKNV
ncbi:MAG: tRNA (cytidine(34)-2'-O)-methyltransferase [Bacilli bacterium]